MKDTPETLCKAPEFWHNCGVDLKEYLWLKTYPVAVRFFEKKEDVPEGLTHPLRDLGKHMAFCQTVSMARMGGDMFAMTREDHWCWDPLLAYGLVDCEPGSKAFEVLKTVIGVPEDKAEAFLLDFPRLERGRYDALAVAPLYKAPFVPDVVLVYCTPKQLDNILGITKAVTGGRIISEFDSIDSCTYDIVPPMLTGDYRITVPDPGERQRASAEDDEIIFSIPACRMNEFITQFRIANNRSKMSEKKLTLRLDFERPPFYNELFALWGLEQGEDWRQS